MLNETLTLLKIDKSDSKFLAPLKFNMINKFKSYMNQHELSFEYEQKTVIRIYGIKIYFQYNRIELGK